jgi:LysR family nitrogen assimilation transcriptional regulator
MDIKQLRNFCQVAESGSLTAAARTLDLTQAALSRQLAMLEAELEVELFRRTGRGLVLTPAGHRLVEQAHLVLQQLAQLPLAVKGTSEAARGTLALGLPPSLARTVVVPLVEAFQQHIPEVVMRSVDGLSANLVGLVASGRLDCAIVYNTLPRDEVILTQLMPENLYLVSGPMDGPPPKTSVLLSEIAELPLIVASRDNAVHETLNAGLARLGKAPQVVHEIANLTAILDLVRKGHGYSVIPVSGVHSCIGDRHLRLHRIRRPALQIMLYLAQPSKSNDPLTRNEIKLLRSVVIEQLNRFENDVDGSMSLQR